VESTRPFTALERETARVTPYFHRRLPICHLQFINASSSHGSIRSSHG
jgi:hypothetical protein